MITPLELVLRTAGEHAVTLDPTDYGVAFIRDLTNHAVPMLEQNRRAYSTANEDALTSVLLANVQMAYQGATRESHSNGHVDIALKHPLSAGIVLTGEAKIIGPAGFNWYKQGLTKLVGQYNSGRNDLGLMVCYCRKTNMYTHLGAYAKKITTTRAAFCTGMTDPKDVGLEDLKAIFVTEHSSAGRRVRVVHVWLNMHSTTDDTLIAGAEAESTR